jgi:hypothetical protein
MRIRNIIVACALFGATLLASSADAQWVYRYYDSYRPHSHSYQYWYPQPHYRRWHDTSHWDYHQPRIVPHGTHYHVTPGHYDYHQDGHWH